MAEKSRSRSSVILGWFAVFLLMAVMWGLACDLLARFTRFLQEHFWTEAMQLPETTAWVVAIIQQSTLLIVGGVLAQGVLCVLGAQAELRSGRSRKTMVLLLAYAVTMIFAYGCFLLLQAPVDIRPGT